MTNKVIALIDSDIIAYRIAFACKNENGKSAKNSLNSYLTDILISGIDNTYSGCYADEWILYLTGKNNFRLDIATTAVYKGNRTAPKPAHLSALRKHLVEEWGAVVIDGQEADDAIAIEATKLQDNYIVASVDKDLDQIAGWHYNFVKKIGYNITPEEGMFRFYKQILTGDAADNIMGINGIGPVKADKLLAEAEDENEMYSICLEQYDGNEDRVIENARLLWLRRYENELWQPPQRNKHGKEK